MTQNFETARRHIHPHERPWEQIPDVFGSVEDINDTLVAREQHQFLVTDANGDVPITPDRGLGLYSRDTRHLSGYDFVLDGSRPIVLLSSADSGFSIEQVLGNYRMDQEGTSVGRCTIELVRERVLDGSLHEVLRLTNFNGFPVEVHPAYRFAADFADIFEVRGHKRTLQGRHSPPELGDKSICYRYLGVDGISRRTLIAFDQVPSAMDIDGVSFDLTLQPHETATLSFSVLVEEHAAVTQAGGGLEHLRREYDAWNGAFVRVHSDNEIFNEVLHRSITDMRMLLTRDSHGQGYLAAGIPWFATLFGRDSIIASLQTLPFRPEIARQCLTLLARRQGQSVDPSRCEQPGKILHEVREDELSVVGELPYQRFYGSVDSTPLFLLLAAEYFHWTADEGLIRELMPAMNAALLWIENYGDQDGDGFLDYPTNEAGLRNQGWKDSVDGVRHVDGRLLEGPIALSEVQGYVYMAYQRLSGVFEALGDPGRAAELRGAALELRARFNAAFWLPGEERVAMALDGEKRPADVMSSNAGQVLFSGLLDVSRAQSVRDALFRNDMFSGWGIRTLSSDAAAYNPLGYHVGTVWPHDNGLIALGLKRYGFEAEVSEIATALFDAARHFPGYRLPELFGGQPRSEYRPPVPYPVACRPQAWTAGSMLHLLQAILGLRADAANNELLIVRPTLPYWLRGLHLHGLRVGAGEVDLHFVRRQGRTAVRFETRGKVRVRRSQSAQRFG